MRLMLLLLAGAAALAAQPRVLTPAGAAKPVGPYSPALDTGAYVYVSGQGVRDGAGAMPDGIEAQARQCLANVRAHLEAAGLDFRHVVATQLYLTEMTNLAAVERQWAEAFGAARPPRITLGVAQMPTGTTVEITVVARRAPDARVYLDAIYAGSRQEAERRLAAALQKAGLKRQRVVMANWYTTGAAGPGVLGVSALPGQAQWAVSAIAGKAGPSGSVFCEVVSSSGAGSVEEQTAEAFGKLQACLAKKGATLSHLVATNVYLDDMANFTRMNGAYAAVFRGLYPTRTTVQPVASAQAAGVAVRISGIAEKP